MGLVMVLGCSSGEKAAMSEPIPKETETPAVFTDTGVAKGWETEIGEAEGWSTDTSTSDYHAKYFLGKPEYTDTLPKPPIAWQPLDSGLWFAELPALWTNSIGDSRIQVLKVDAAQQSLTLISQKWEPTGHHTAEEWVTEKGLMAAVNAGMFSLEDHATNTGYMVHYEQINNARFNSSYNLVAAFNPKSDTVPAFQILDVSCQPWDVWKGAYHSYVQGLRIVDCNQRVRWTKQEKFWSMVLLGQTHNQEALFIFCRSPYRVHDLAHMLLQLPLNLARLMYLEGGPEASMVVNTPQLQWGLMGSYETNFVENDLNHEYWVIPNLIGVLPR